MPNSFCGKVAVGGNYNSTYDIQEGFYKYQVYLKNGQVWVKMIIRDFLYCEVAMLLDTSSK